MISVIVLNWNGKHHLDSCLSSLQNQTCDDFEMILVDNGSTDGSVEHVRTRFPKVKIVSLPTNTGFCRGNNEGIKRAKGDYIALLNNDTEVDPRWLEELYKALQTDSSVGFCASKVLFYDQRDRIDSAGDYYSICGAGGKIGHLSKDDGTYEHRREVFGACAAAAIYRKSMLDEIGLLDEDFFLIHEDTDLSFRAQLSGYKCLYVPTARVYHKVNASLGQYSEIYVYYGHRNVEYVFFKDMPASLILKYFIVHIAYILMAFGYFATRGKGVTFLRSKFAALKTLPMKKRKSIQGARLVSEAYIESILRREWFRPRMKTHLHTT